MCLLPTSKLLRSQSRGFIIYHFSSLCLIQSQARCLVDWKRASWGEEKLMYIHFLTNKLSREALKSGLLWIGFAAIWTWTVVARYLDYQRSNPFAVHGQTNAEEKAISCAEKLVLELTRTVPFMFLLLWHKASVIETFPRTLLMGTFSWWQPESWWQGDKAILTKAEELSLLLVIHNQLRNKQFSFPREAEE